MPCWKPLSFPLYTVRALLMATWLKKLYFKKKETNFTTANLQQPQERPIYNGYRNHGNNTQCVLFGAYSDAILAILRYFWLKLISFS
jgi:hypothetical protein